MLTTGYLVTYVILVGYTVFAAPIEFVLVIIVGDVDVVVVYVVGWRGVSVLYEIVRVWV